MRKYTTTAVMIGANQPAISNISDEETIQLNREIVILNLPQEKKLKCSTNNTKISYLERQGIFVIKKLLVVLLASSAM